MRSWPSPAPPSACARRPKRAPSSPRPSGPHPHANAEPAAARLQEQPVILPGEVLDVRVWPAFVAESPGGRASRGPPGTDPPGRTASGSCRRAWPGERCRRRLSEATREIGSVERDVSLIESLVAHRGSSAPATTCRSRPRPAWAARLPARGILRQRPFPESHVRTTSTPSSSRPGLSTRSRSGRSRSWRRTQSSN